MDDIAFDSGLTQTDRADRVRKLWDAYREEHGGELQDFVSDLLHLADVDDVPGGAQYVARRGVGNYVAELPTFPEDQHALWPHLGQARTAATAWVTLSGGDSPREAAERLNDAMQSAGFHFSELSAHADDLAQGHVLTAEDGREFRVIPRPAS